MSTLGERLGWILKNRNMSARQLSLDAGASASYVAQIIRGDIGEGIAYDRCVSLAKAGGVSSYWLLTGEGGPDAPEPTTSEPVYDEELPLIDRALAMYAPVPADAAAHVRRRYEESVAFLGGATPEVLVPWVRGELAAYKTAQSGLPPKTKEAPDTVVQVREGAMRLAPGKPRGRG